MFRRFRKPPISAQRPDIIVAHASETGTAECLADATADALRAGGAKVVAASLVAVEPADLVAARHTFLLVSTTGDGEPPDAAYPFLEKLRGAKVDGAAFAMLALGDRGYGDENFCGGGEAVRAALLSAGAREEAPLERADGEPRESWRSWLDRMAAALRLDTGEAHTPAGDVKVQLELIERVQLNDPAFPETTEAWALTFQSPTPLAFRPGDLLLVPPPGGGPDRLYSIGSAAAGDPRRLLLTVSLTRSLEVDGTERLGAASGLLCRGLQVGDRIDAALRRHPSFNLPDDPATPVILVAAGAGIAPFVGFLDEREAAAAAGARAGPVWLVFGNRRADGDFLYREKIERWSGRGLLTRCDTAFSREPGRAAYAQERLREAGGEVVRWMAQREAVLFVCGRAKTLGAGIDAALRDIVIEQGLVPSRAEADRCLAAWEAEGRIRRDLFD